MERESNAKIAKDIPALVALISTKEEEIHQLLKTNGVSYPQKLKGNVYKAFKLARNEILATLTDLEQLGYQGKEGVKRKADKKNGPYFVSKKINYKSARFRKGAEKVKRGSQEWLENAKQINGEKMYIRFNI